MTAKKTSSGKKEKEEKDTKKTGFLTDATESIEAGARIIGEKAARLASGLSDKTSEIAGKIKEEVKEPASEALATARKAIDELSDTAQGYIEKYRHKVEMERIARERDTLIKVLGQLVYLKLKSKNAARENIFDNQDVMKLVKDIKKKDREIINLGKKSDE